MLDGLTLDQMRMFVAVADAGSFRAGAGRLMRAQSAISHAIGNLEAQLGLTLFDRTGHRPTLTREGVALLSDARTILLKVDTMRARARGLGKGVELDFSVVVDTLFPTAVVATALLALQTQFPSVEIQLEIEPLGGPLASLRDGRCAVGILVGEDFRDPRIEFQALTTLSIVAIVAEHHPLAAHAKGLVPITTSTLADHRQVVLTDPTTLSDGRDFQVLSPGTYKVNSQEAKHSLIRAGLGWGRLPSWLVKQDLEDGRLVRLPAASLGKNGEASVQAYLAHRVDQPFGPAARIFEQAITQGFGP